MLVLGPGLFLIYFKLSGQQWQHLSQQRVIQINAVSLLLAFFLVGSYSFWVRKTIRSFFVTSSLFKDVLIGCVACVISYPFVMTAGHSIALLVRGLTGVPSVEQIAVRQLLASLESPWTFVTLLSCVIFLAPVVEELLFRGFLQSYIKQLFGPFMAIVSSSLLFALFHYDGSQGWTNIEILVSLFLLSCFLGFVRERQKTLFAPIALHMTFNLVNVSLIFLISSG